MAPLQSDDTRHLERLSYSLNVMPWGILQILTANGEVVYSNNQAGFYFDRVASELIGLNAHDLWKGCGVAEDLKPFTESKKAICYDFEAQTPDGPIWTRFHFIPHREDQKYCLIVIEDTTESKMFEKQSLQSQKLEALGQLAGGVAHDFNNILSIIDGYAYMIRKLGKHDTDIESYVERLMQAVKRGSALTSQLLTFGRHKIVKDSVIDLGQLVREQEALLRPLMDASVSLSLHAEDNIYIDAQDDQICQILLNLCVNARDAITDNGSVLIETKLEDNKACLRVTDTGCGMTHDVKEKIFDPFFSTKEEGTGLGLSMVYGLVRELEGTIDVNSAPGKGTSFTLHFPLSRKTPTLKDTQEGSGARVMLKGYTALIAEDEPDLLELVSGMVEDMGVHVLRANNGSEALVLQEMYDGRIDFLLTDVIMPDLNGVKLAEMFETARPSARVMFMSGYPEESGQMSRASLPDGAFLVSKPVNYDKLGHVLKLMVKDQNNDKSKGFKPPIDHWRTA